MADVQKYVSDDELPELYIPHPQCSHCYNDVVIEDGYAHCLTCLIMWDRLGEGVGGFIDPGQSDGTLCGELNIPQRSSYDYKGKRWEFGPSQPCILPLDHRGKCLCPYEVTVTPLVSGNEEE